VAADAVVVRTPRSRAGEGLSRRASFRLVGELLRRDLALHYRHTRLGILWAVLPPLVAAGAIDLFLGDLVRLGATDSRVPATAFLYAGLLPWQFFARAATAGSASMLGNAWVLSQVSFPRSVLPVTAVLSGAVDLLLGSVVLFAMLVLMGHPPGVHLLWWPLAVGPLLLLSLAAAFLLSASTVVLRDVQHATPYAVRLLFLASPVLYAADAVSGLAGAIVRANPLTGALEAHRAAWIGGPVNLGLLGVSWATGAALLGVAVLAFRRLEPRFGDVL
jgi:lipopolysaccharide transport system permease protein